MTSSHLASLHPPPFNARPQRDEVMLWISCLPRMTQSKVSYWMQCHGSSLASPSSLAACVYMTTS